jgi:small-conductance mechanosensitive channel
MYGGIAIAVVAFVALLRRLLTKRLRNAAATETEIDDFFFDFLERTKLWLVFFVAIWASYRHLPIDPQVLTILKALAIAAGVMQGGIWGAGFIDFSIQRYRRRRFETDPSAVTTIAAFGVLGKIAVWAVLVLAGLQNILGSQLTPLIASLGVGGIAVALAAQNILGDLFASLSIVIDKPFVLGDFIVVGTEAGTVEKIGLKTTRIRSLSGEQIIFSNGDLLSSRVRNFKRMIERRALFTFGVTYGTSREKLEAIPQMVREIVEATPDTRFDRAHLKRFADSALEFEAVYWIIVPEYNAFMDAQQRINLELISRLEALGVDFAFPTRTIHVEGLSVAGAPDGPEPPLR